MIFVIFIADFTLPNFPCFKLTCTKQRKQATNNKYRGAVNYIYMYVQYGLHFGQSI